MVDGQVVQAFGNKPETSAEFKTGGGTCVKVFVRPGSLFCRDFEKWLADNEIHSFKHSLVAFDGQIACVVTYRKSEAIAPESLLKDTVTLMLDIVEQVHQIARVVQGVAPELDSSLSVRETPPLPKDAPDLPF